MKGNFTSLFRENIVYYIKTRKYPHQEGFQVVTVRELSKVLDRPNLAAFKEMKRVTKFVLDTPDHGLKIEPEKMTEDKWVLKVYTDSDWAGDKDSRISVSGYVLFLMNVSILWRSKSQKALALSSSEAE